MIPPPFAAAAAESAAPAPHRHQSDLIDLLFFLPSAFRSASADYLLSCAYTNIRSPIPVNNYDRVYLQLVTSELTLFSPSVA